MFILTPEYKLKTNMKKREIEEHLEELLFDCIKPHKQLSGTSYFTVLKMLKLVFWLGYQTAAADTKNNAETILRWVKK